MEPQKIPNNQSNPEEKNNKAGGITIPDRFQDTLQSCSDPNSKIMAQKLTHRSMEKNRQLRNKPTIIGSINPQKDCEARLCNGQRTIFSTKLLGKLDSYILQKNEVEPLSSTIRKNKLKTD